MRANAIEFGFDAAQLGGDLRQRRPNDLRQVLVGLVVVDVLQGPPQARLPRRRQLVFALSAAAPGDDIFAKLERLAGLRDKGILSEEEFAAKKAELLSRL